MDLLDNISMSSNNTLFNYDQTYSPSSELNLSVLLQSINDLSSLPLSHFDQDECTILNDDQEKEAMNESLSLTISQRSSDNESVLYLRLPNELNIDVATMESDFERLDR